MATEELLSPDTRAKLADVSTATICTRLFARGMRNAFLHGLAPLGGHRSKMIGPAFTLRYIPAREDVDVLDLYADYDHPQRLAIETAPKDSVLVMDCRGHDRAAAAGHILMTRLASRGVAGMVTDGSVRDSQEISEMKFPVYAKSRSANTNLVLHHAVDLNVPIGCAEVPVYPGDVMVGDREGVVCIPRHLVDVVAQEAWEMQRLEDFLTARVAQGAPLKNTYPPSESTMALYRKQRSDRFSDGDGVGP